MTHSVQIRTILKLTMILYHSDMVEEIWKDVIGYEGIYEVSNLGGVRTTLGKTTYTEWHGTRHWEQRYMKQKTDKNGYKRVSLWMNGKNKDFLVHRLVGIAFIDNIDNKPHINHIDGNTSNNNIKNLEWIDECGNINHAFDNRLIKTGIITILTDKVTGEIHEFRSLSKASLFLGVNSGYISYKMKKNGFVANEKYDIVCMYETDKN